MWTPDITRWPMLAPVRQRFDAQSVQNVEAAVRDTVAQLFASGKLKAVTAGQTVAITAGSRGIDRIAEVTAALVAICRDMGLDPYIVPSMGSHGGATAEGQVKVLASLGITEASIGAPIRSSMDVVRLGETEDGIPVFMDSLAMQADHIIIANRIKSHTKFKAPIESGLFKMACIGLGKHTGAALYHKLAVRHGFARVIREAGRLTLAKAPILFGLGLVENAHGKLHTIKAIAARNVEAEEEKLLMLCKQLSPKLPFAAVDLLIVDAIGKNISGTGMDVNVTGRNRDILGDFTSTPRISRIFVRDLTPESEGNALGIGFADFTTDRLVNAMDYGKTVTNALTGISPEKAAIPIHYPTDRQALQAALHSLGDWQPETVRIVRIADTLHLENIYVSPALFEELPLSATHFAQAEAMHFGPDDNLLPFPA
ncbi:nickel-dependent lactate racemase [Desulfovibrio mangrovi]|uniref:lactate racemase domain-containing protein n=1 Tax=Desulfovibrio mangrovi TaxID=2976983 RepID=UPI002245CC90|nr:lactate racemase domain-containing protein [Desulfovibrio mangrovi]UZP68038.1 nickel-dependent lactate racemase [Desulfovibrio mangrovi]